MEALLIVGACSVLTSVVGSLALQAVSKLQPEMEMDEDTAEVYYILSSSYYTQDQQDLLIELWFIEQELDYYYLSAKELEKLMK